MKSCGTTVQNSLQAVTGVDKVEIKLDACRHVAKVYGTASLPSLIQAVEDVGFGANQIEDSPADITLHVEGMMWYVSSHL